MKGVIGLTYMIAVLISPKETQISVAAKSIRLDTLSVPEMRKTWRIPGYSLIFFLVWKTEESWVSDVRESWNTYTQTHTCIQFVCICKYVCVYVHTHIHIHIHFFLRPLCIRLQLDSTTHFLGKLFSP